jgi:periplasmic protein TonB
MKGRPPKDHRLAIALGISAALHGAAVAAVLIFLRAAPPAEVPPEKAPEIELVMVEHKGEPGPTTPPLPSPAPSAKPTHPSEPSAARVTRPAQAPARAAQATKTPPEQPAPPAESTKASDTAPAVTARDSKSALTAPASAPAKTDATATQKVPPAPIERAVAPESRNKRSLAARTPPPVPKINLSGTDSPSDARAFGDRIIPAAPNAVFHNRPPIYPMDAAIAGEHGTVILQIHVSPSGRAEGVEIVQSSGYALLDRAARDAVKTWRFLPAVKDGRTIESDMSMRFIFDDQ